MGKTYSLIEGPYLRDLLDQGDCLRRTQALPLPSALRDVFERLQAQQRPELILTGMGSSFHALHPIAIRLQECGIRVVMLETSEFIYYWSGLLGENTIVIAVSQSGRSVEMLRLLDLNAGRSTVIGVTNDRDSPLARAANGIALMSAGKESTVSCKTYLCTLLMLDRIAEALCTGDLNYQAPETGLISDAVDAYFSSWQKHVEEAHDCLQHIRYIVLAGRGPSLAAAGTGGLIIKEAARFPAEGMSAAAFRHGPLEMASEQLFLLVFEGDQRSAAMNRKLVQDVVALGGRAQLISPGSQRTLFRTSTNSQSLRCILEILPVQIISLALAARDGREAGAFAHASKVTSVE